MKSPTVELPRYKGHFFVYMYYAFDFVCITDAGLYKYIAKEIKDKTTSLCRLSVKRKACICFYSYKPPL